MNLLGTCHLYGLLMLCLVLFPAISRAGQPIDWSAQPKCLPTWIAAGQRTVTPAKVIGATDEHLTLLRHNPSDIRYTGERNPHDGYLISGNSVDLVTECAGFAYVRFHGPKIVSTGWVDATRIRSVGPSHSTLPTDAITLCAGAQHTLDRGKQLAAPPTVQIDDKVLDRILPPGWQTGPNGSPPIASQILVDGRPMMTVVIDSGGTAHSTSVYLLSSNLEHLLSPHDRDDRDVENTGADDWGFGVSEGVVLVDGQPMVRSWSSNGPSYLSVIDRDGDIVPTCEISIEPRMHPTISMSTNNTVCQAILAGHGTPVPMHSPARGESLVMETVPPRLTNYGGSIHSTPTELNYHDTEMAASVTYTLMKTGSADLDNSGRLAQVGLVSFWEGDSSAGDGSYTDSQVFPIYLDANGVANLSAEANRKLAESLPHGANSGQLMTLDGITYLETSPKSIDQPNAVWKIDSDGAHPICSFHLTRTVVYPLSP